MLGWLKDLRIKFKLAIGFSMLILIMIVIVALMNLRLSFISESSKQIVDLRMPTATHSATMQNGFNHALAALRGWMLLNDESYKTERQQTWETEIYEPFAQLKELSKNWTEPENKQLINQIGEKLDEFAKVQKEIEDIANTTENIPSLKMLVNEVAPLSDTIEKNISRMIRYEVKIEAAPERRALLAGMADFGNSMGLAMSDLRAFLISGDKQYDSRFQMRWAINQNKYGYLESSIELMNKRQVNAFNNLKEARDQLKEYPQRIIDMRKSPEWNLANHMLATKAVPMGNEITAMVKQLAANQTTLLRKSGSSIDESITSLQFTVLLALLLGVGAGLICSGFITTTITEPVKDLEHSARQLARGVLGHEIDTSRKDELGALAISFASMRDSIRKKIDDLHLLNATGEELAALHDQTKALRAALRVMSQQTHVELGSIFLLNAEDELCISAYYPSQEALNSTTPKSFKLGEGIAGKAAQLKKNIFIPDTSKNSDYVDLPQGKEPRALICVPMMDDQQVFGVMNFSGKVGQVQFDAEDENFALTIARMTVVTIKNIQMMAVIEEHNRTLEEKVRQRTAELAKKNRDINNMLQNMHQGIFTVIQDMEIHHEHSAYLMEILEEENLAGQNCIDILFQHSNVGSDGISQVEAALDAVGDDVLMFTANEDVLVREYQKTMHDGRVKILEVDWDPIADEDDTLEKIMVTLRDVTEVRKLQQEAEQQRKELEMIGQILATTQKDFHDFLGTANKYLALNRQLIEDTTQKDDKVLATLFRNMHTIKGNARTQGLTYCTDTIHEVEHRYDDLRRDPDASWNQDLLLKDLDEAKASVEVYSDLYSQKLEQFTNGGGELIPVEKGILDQFHQIASNSGNYPSVAELSQDLQKTLAALDSESIPTLLKGVTDALPYLAQQLQKEAPKVVIQDQGIRVYKPMIPVLKDVFTHLFRNCIDHGLEGPEERTQKGKPRTGTIQLDVSISENWVQFSLGDDGRGLNLAKLRQKAKVQAPERDVETMGDQETAQLIFESGVSTAESLSNISGRGVGMDAVRNFIKENGGDVELELTAAGNDQGRGFKIKLKLPANTVLAMN